MTPWRALLAALCAAAAGGAAAGSAPTTPTPLTPAPATANCSVPRKPCPMTAHRTWCPSNPDKHQCSETPCDTQRQPCPAPFPTGSTWCPSNTAVAKKVQCEGGLAGPTNVTIHTDVVTHEISELAMGCHSDSGYEHQPRGFYAQM